MKKKRLPLAWDWRPTRSLGKLHAANDVEALCGAFVLTNYHGTQLMDFCATCLKLLRLMNRRKKP